MEIERRITMKTKTCDLCGSTKEKNNCHADIRFDTSKMDFLIPDTHWKGEYLSITRDVCTTCKFKIEKKIGELATEIKGGPFEPWTVME
jgi:hypothetical protein